MIFVVSSLRGCVIDWYRYEDVMEDIPAMWVQINDMMFKSKLVL